MSCSLVTPSCTTILSDLPHLINTQYALSSLLSLATAWWLNAGQDMHVHWPIRTRLGTWQTKWTGKCWARTASSPPGLTCRHVGVSSTQMNVALPPVQPMPAGAIALPTCTADVAPYWRSSALWIQHMEKVRERRQQWNWDVAQRVSAIHASVSRIKMFCVNTSVKNYKNHLKSAKPSLD